ncbi:UDP-glucose 4-epimerase family protein [Pseudomonadota bacterium DY0742]
MALEPRRILVTGATGFVGHALMLALAQRFISTVGTVRRSASTEFDGPNIECIGELNAATDWSSVLVGVKVVIHTAARPHIMNDQVPDPLTEYRRINVNGTLALARQAAEAGVRRFIFISSIKVNGEGAPLGLPYRANDVPDPQDFYGISKLEAEQGLMKVAADIGMEVVIVRPPLVYGPGVKGNFASMAKLMEKGLPLPLGAVYNKRSLVGIDNLVDLIIRCIEHPAAANQVFLAGDGEDLSTTELLRGMANAMGKPARLIPVPAGLLQLAATLLGKKAMAQRLLGSLQVDISKTCEVLDWKPPYTVEEGLRRCFEPSH